MLYYNTVNYLLKESLQLFMAAEEFNTFRLVGGTALSLHIGHRASIDIDLFSDVTYRSIDFDAIERFLHAHFPYIDYLSNLLPAMGKSYTIGTDVDNAIKLDVFYTDPFIRECVVEDGIRLASIEEIIAMKIDVIQRGGRKKDFWDLHALLPQYSIAQMLDLHNQRYPYNHEVSLILKNLTDFSIAENQFDPVCFRGNYWEFIKADIEDAISEYVNR